MDKSYVVPVVKSPHNYQAYRISPDATNRLAIVFDPATVNLSIMYCIEITDSERRSGQLDAENIAVLRHSLNQN